MQDSYGNTVTSDTGNVTLTKSTGPGAGALSCTATTVAASAGVASFAGCQITGTAAAGAYTLVATRTGLTSTGSSSSVVINVGAANKLAFTAQPVGGVAEGVALAAQPVVTVQDAYGNTVSGDTGAVTLAISTGPGAGALACTSMTVAAVAGVATFAGCQVTGTAAAGTYTLVGTRSGLTSTGSSSNVVINVGAANKLAFTTQPVGGVAIGTVLPTQPVVTVQDSYGNTVTTDTGSVTLAKSSGPATGSLSCTATTVTAAAGVATFAGCKITGTTAGGLYTVTATRSGLTSTGSSSGFVVADNATPTISSVALANHGTAGTVDAGDTATIGFSQPMRASTFCSAWTSDTVTQTITGATLTLTSAGGAGDRLTVSAASGCTFALGTVRAGVKYLTSGNVTFSSSTITYDPSAKTLTLTLGTPSSTTTIKTGVTAGRPRYQPSSGHLSIIGLTLSTRTVTSSTASGW